MVDTGLGGNRPVAPWAPGEGLTAEQAYEDAGVDPSEVSTVVLTHMHPDHSGGIRGSDGEPRFANARHVLHPADWAFLAGELSEFSALARPGLHRVHELGMLDLDEGNREVVPGIEVRHTPGHTPGHRSVLVHEWRRGHPAHRRPPVPADPVREPVLGIEPRRGSRRRCAITGRDRVGRRRRRLERGRAAFRGAVRHGDRRGLELPVERVVVALGGNALLRQGAEDTFEEMYRASREAAERIADIAADGWEVVVTHGNGPQVGRILLQQEAAREVVHPMPLDVCGAESQGQIGYLLQVTIGDVFFERGMERPVATVLTLTRVRPDDPAFTDPTKFVGPFYEPEEARALESERGYVMKADPHGGWRRVVPSPSPYSIVETPVIRQLVAAGTIVIASGGGGVPVIEDGPRLIGKEGVVDKDRAAAILAKEVEASTLLILTDVKKVQRGYGSFMPEDIDRMTVREATQLLRKGEFGAGSMGPKVEAAATFARGGGRSVIADLADATAALAGSAGTQIVKD